MPTETTYSMFETVRPGLSDPMFELKRLADNDLDPRKVDVGVGIYRNERGKYQELSAVQAAKKILDDRSLGHDYELTTGDSRFLEFATKIVFGDECRPEQYSRIGSVQSISGTGACHLAALFLRRCSGEVPPQIYVGTPTWGNYEPLCRLVGLTDIQKYNYFCPRRRQVDFESILQAVETAPTRSIFILQACCHNPTGVDLTHEQWQILAEAMKRRNQFPFFDIAYQGLSGDSLDDGAFAIRLFVDMGFEMVVCQSFSKNFGLYGERCGVLHIVTKSEEHAICVKDQLRTLIRWEFSSSPAYGSRLVTIICEDKSLKEDWMEELASIRQRLDSLRSQLYDEVSKLPGNWKNIKHSTGLFCFLPLSPAQCQALVQQHHIYLPPNGRINISGINKFNLKRVVLALKAVASEGCGTSEDTVGTEARLQEKK